MNDEAARVTREEFERMEMQVSQTAAQVKDLHKALFEPPMEGGESLIRRMKKVTEDIETGKRGIGWIIWIIGLLAAFGVYIKFGGVGE
jgi:ATP-dependent RNA circularization protein (DNA/RNA ligase family)